MAKQHVPDWGSFKNWETGKRITLLEAFGISSVKFRYPKLRPRLGPASARAQHPLAVQTSGSQEGGGVPVVDKGKGPVKQYARKLLKQYNWADQWDSFSALVNAEDSTWNPKIFNLAGSGAFGIAQALQNCSPDTQGTMANKYCGYGVSTKTAKAANSGDPYAQLQWMMGYIQQRYGSPDAAWAFHQKNNWY